MVSFTAKTCAIFCSQNVAPQDSVQFDVPCAVQNYADLRCSEVHGTYVVRKAFGEKVMNVSYVF